MTLHFITRLEIDYLLLSRNREGRQDQRAVNLIYLRTQPMENIAFLTEEYWRPKFDLCVVFLLRRSGYWESIIVNTCSDTTVALP